MARSSGVRLLTWALGGLLLGAALAFLLLNVVARTKPGHEKVLQITLNALGKSIHGKLVVGRVAGNLFEGAKLYDVSLKDNAGRPFVLADSAYAEYDVRTLLSPRIVINRLTLYRPSIYVFRMPGDSLWNYEALFQDTTRFDSTRTRLERSTNVALLHLVNGTVTVETPFRADSTLSPAAQRRQIRGFMADSSPVVIRQVANGYVRTVVMRQVNGRLSNVRFGPGSDIGTILDIDTLRANVHFYRKPIIINHLQGKLALPGPRSDTVGHKGGWAELDAPVVRLPHTKMAVSGVVRFGDFPAWFDPAQAPMYDFAMRGDSVSFGDFRWLYARFPSDLRGSMNLLIETRPQGIMITARNARLRAPGTAIDGSFGMIVGDTLRFVDMNVQARPVRVSFIEHMLPDGLPVRGLVLGGVDIRGNNAPAAPADDDVTAAADTPATRRRAPAPPSRAPATRR